MPALKKMLFLIASVPEPAKAEFRVTSMAFAVASTLALPEPSDVTTADAQIERGGYQLTAHVRRYYETTRV